MANDLSLTALRKQIDGIDDRILELLNQRARCAQQVAETKTAAGEADSFYRPEREIEVLRRMAETNPGPLGREAVIRFFRELMSECLALEKPLRVAFLGPEGTFTQQAAYKHFGHAVQATPLPAIDEIFRAVESGTCPYGVVPVENSTEGMIAHTLDSFVRSDLIIAGEVQLRIHHSLLCKQSVQMDAVTEVFSHQQSLGQCRNWLDRFLPNAKRSPVASNAEAARCAAEIPGAAAIAGEVAAAIYGLEILERNIEDEPDNTTRFLVIGSQPVGPTGHDKTSLLLSTRNDPGALYRVIEPFARLGIGMTKIESRPSRRGMWDYFFFIDVEGHQADPALRQALAEVRAQVSTLKVLGSYPRALS